jgi:RimJ/RimL family protein N-acetyltransferase
MTRTPTHLPTTLQTPRLRLRPFTAADAQRVALFVGERDVARMLARVPYPYAEADAIRWIADPSETDRWAIVHANGVIGAVAVEQRAGVGAVLGYWLGKPFWGRGLMTEAAGAVVAAWRAAHPTTPLHCDHADDNPASRAVIRKLGFVPTGTRTGWSLARNAEVTLSTYRLPTPAVPARASSAVPRPDLIPA